MLIVEWLMRLPSAEGTIVVDMTVTKAMSDEEAVGEASAMWSSVRGRERMPPHGYRIVDPDGRIRSGPCFDAFTVHVA